jgi:hypothetical protein
MRLSARFGHPALPTENMKLATGLVLFFWWPFFFPVWVRQGIKFFDAGQCATKDADHKNAAVYVLLATKLLFPLQD